MNEELVPSGYRSTPLCAELSPASDSRAYEARAEACSDTQSPSGQLGDATLESEAEELTYYSDGVPLAQKRALLGLSGGATVPDELRPSIYTVITIGGRGCWRATTTRVKCIPRNRRAAAHVPHVRQPRAPRRRARRLHHAAGRSSRRAASNDGDGQGDDGPVPSARPALVPAHQPSPLRPLRTYTSRILSTLLDSGTRVRPDTAIGRWGIPCRLWFLRLLRHGRRHGECVDAASWRLRLRQTQRLALVCGAPAHPCAVPEPGGEGGKVRAVVTAVAIAVATGPYEPHYSDQEAAAASNGWRRGLPLRAAKADAPQSRALTFLPTAMLAWAPGYTV